MIVGIGTDLIKVARIEQALHRNGDKFARRILAPEEWEAYQQSNKPLHMLAKRFAVKEAAAKALGTGIGKVSWHDIYVEHDELGAPLLRLANYAAELAAHKAVAGMHVSISDEDNYAQAFVVLSK